jgi:hypothetical protein
MSINTKVRLALAASVVAFAAAAPVSIALGAGAGYHPEGSSIDGTKKMTKQQGTDTKLVPVDVVPDANTGRQSTTTTRQKMRRKSAPSATVSPGMQQSGLPKY